MAAVDAPTPPPITASMLYDLVRAVSWRPTVGISWPV